MRPSRAVAVLLAFLLPAQLALADALERIVDRETIRLGVRMSSAPFSYKDENGQPAGLAVSLCQRVAQAIKQEYKLKELTIEYVYVNSKSRFSAIDEEVVDMHCGPMTQTLQRRKELDFSIPYFMDGISPALRRDGVQDVAELDGQPVGALKGTTAVPLAQLMAEPVGSKVIAFDSHEQGLRALGRGEIDIYFGDQGLLLYQLSVLKAEDRLIPITVLPEQFSYEPYSIAMKGGERRLRLETDRALSRIFLSRVVFEDIEKAFGTFEMSEVAAFLYVLVALPE
ncbi:MAG: amino acid ABC transporter substrate-binding protein [Pseudomonadota bacterium]